MDEIGSATNSATQTPITQSGSQGGILEQEDFLEIMIAELSNQDPFEPMDNREFLGQLTEMQNLEASTTMTTSLSALADSLGAITFGQQLASAGALIGQMVTGTDTGGNDVIGVVTRFVVEGENVLLGLEGAIGHGDQENDATVPSSTQMELNNVAEVRGPVLVEISQDEVDAATAEQGGETPGSDDPADDPSPDPDPAADESQP